MTMAAMMTVMPVMSSAMAIVIFYWWTLTIWLRRSWAWNVWSINVSITGFIGYYNGRILCVVNLLHVNSRVCR